MISNNKQLDIELMYYFKTKVFIPIAAHRLLKITGVIPKYFLKSDRR